MRSRCPRLDRVIVVTAADDRYALPLAVMGRSLIDNFSPRQKLALYVFDGGIRARNRRKLMTSWDLTKAEVALLKANNRLIVELAPPSRETKPDEESKPYRMTVVRVLPDGMVRLHETPPWELTPPSLPKIVE